MIYFGFVTYNDRYTRLTESVKKLIGGTTIVAHNGCREPQLGIAHHNILIEENSGSAGGYAAIVDYFLRNCLTDDYLVLLDDDNLITPGFTKNLKAHIKNGLIVGGCYRRSRAKTQAEYIRKSYRYYQSDNFFGLNIFSTSTEDSKNLGVAPYGGLVLCYRACEQLGLPLSSWFIYGDDIEYTLRAKALGIRIQFLSDCIIDDQEMSTNKEDSRHRYFQASLSLDLLYSQLQNHAKLSEMTRSSWRYSVNKIVFICLIFMYGISGRAKFSRIFFVLRRLF